MPEIVFLLEEPSARDALEGMLLTVLPPDVQTKYLVFEGKQDLEKRMARTLRAWRTPDAKFIVLRDQDSGDCYAIKKRLLERCREARREDRAIVRIACRELESWFLGDWSAIAAAFGVPRVSGFNDKAAYRNPDQVVNPAMEIKKHIPSYQKRDGARRIGRHLKRDSNTSHSFCVFVDAVVRLTSES